MKNLAGDDKPDSQIEDELDKAIIAKKGVPLRSGNVRYTTVGELDNWTFTRAQYCWIATASEGNGLPLDVAIELHGRRYELHAEAGHLFVGLYPETYGKIIRVAGESSCPNPLEWDQQNGLKGIIDLYHIYSQPGLNEFSRIVRSL